MTKKTKSIILYSSLGIVSVTSISIASYSIIKIIQNKNQRQSSSSVKDWENVPEETKRFSENNSFKIRLKASRSIVTFGTAWTWYYNKKSQYSYDWYLMTNFHVVNNAIAYVNGLSEEKINQTGNLDLEITDSDALLNYYSTNTITNFDLSDFNFSLSKFINNQYKNVVSNLSVDKPIVDKEAIESFQIITDFNNDNVKLFSNGDVLSNAKNSYNLDMALIKISLNLNSNKYSEEYIDNYVCPNIWNMYSNGQERISLQSNTYKYISGNPHNANRLVGVLFEKDIKWEMRESSLSIDNDEILKKLRAPYTYSNKEFQNFILTGGSSGSPVYQLENPLQDLNNILPLAIYWGGVSNHLNGDLFRPSIIPFYVNGVYDIFDNFGQYINLNIV